MQHINIFTKTRWLVTIILLTTLCIGNVWGADNTVTWTATSGALGTVGATSTKNQTGSISTGSYSWNYTRTLKSGTQYAPSWVGGTSNFIQLGKNGCVENIEFTTSAIPGTIKTVSIICSSYGASHKVNISVGGTSYVSNANTPSGQNVDEVKNTTTGTSSGSITISITGGSRYVCIKSISVKYNNDAPVASCTATPSIGVVSLNGSFSLTSVGVQCASASAGSNCSLSEYGFVWGTSNASGHPNKDDHIVTNSGAYSANYTNTLTGSFSADVTYYYRGYAKNNGNIYGYSEAVQSFTPRTVNYNKNESSATGSVTQQVLNTGGTVTLAAANSFAWTGHHIEKWAQGSASGTQYNPGATSPAINASTTFYAIWALNSHSLTWNVNGGDPLTGSYTSGTINYGTSITAPDTPTRTGYTFGGWHNGTSVVTPATSMPDNNLTYTAQWTANKYDIIYKDQGGGDFTGTQTSAPTQHTYDKATTLKIPTKTGYTFGGWFTASDCTSGAVGNTTSASLGATDYTDNIILYAKWTKNSYTLTWNLNGGTVTVAGTGAAVDATGTPNSSVPYNDAITAPTVTKYGYNFSSWNNTPASNMPAANTTYTAQWTAKSFTVTWMVNVEAYSGGSSSVNFNGHVSTLPTDPDPADYCGKKFMGWTTVENVKQNDDTGLGLFTTAGTAPTVTVEGNVTYYAVFADYAE